MKLTFTRHHMLMIGIALVLGVCYHFGIVGHEGVLGIGLVGAMTNSQARVIDPILSTVAQGYKNNEFIGMKLFPSVPVGQRGGKIITFGREAFRLYSTGRAPGAEVKRIQFGYAGSPFALEQHALAGMVPIENMDEAAAVPGIDLGTGAVQAVQAIIGLRLEYAQAQLATTAGNYSAGNKVTLAGTSQWSDYASGVSDPVNDIEAGKEAIRAKTGKRPNICTIPAAVWAKLRNHPKTIERIKYTGRDSATTALVAEWFGIDEVVVGDAIYDNNGTFVDVWGKSVVLAYTNKTGISQGGLPSYGYTYRLGGYPLVEQAYYDKDHKSWIYPVTDEVSPVIAGQDAGYLISAAVA